MVSPNVNRMLQQATSLSLAERQQFIELLTHQLAQAQPRLQEDEIAPALAKQGIILTVPPEPTPEDIARFKAWRPIELPGGPLSDDIVNDRR